MRKLDLRGNVELVPAVRLHILMDAGSPDFHFSRLQRQQRQWRCFLVVVVFSLPSVFLKIHRSLPTTDGSAKDVSQEVTMVEVTSHITRSGVPRSCSAHTYVSGSIELESTFATL